MGDFIKNKFVTIRAEIEGEPKEADFVHVSADINTRFVPGSNCVLVKCLQVSIDPYQLNRMKTYSSSQKSVHAASKLVPGKPIDAYGIGRVVASKSPEFQKGDLVLGLLSWAEYVEVEPGKPLRKLDFMGFPFSYHLGLSGLTAYGGFFKVCKPKKGDRVFVSAAVGSVGNLVAQYAKLLGCSVVGCERSSEKVAILKDKLGLDDAFNYKEQCDLKSTLRRYFPDGIDIYFDNVGGEMLEAAVANMNPFGRVAASGAISQYTEPTGPRSAVAAPDMIDIIYKRITIQGFLSPDFTDDDSADFVAATTDHLRAGELKILEDVSQGLKSIPSAFTGLFCGRNIGKTIVQIAED